MNRSNQWRCARPWRALGAVAALALLAGCGTPAGKTEQKVAEGPPSGEASKPAVKTTTEAPPSPPAPPPAPPQASDVKIQVLDQAGLGALLAKHRGKIVVMDAWATY